MRSLQGEEHRWRPNRKLLIALLIGASCISTFLGMRAMFAFDETAGEVGLTPVDWPSASRIQRPAGRPELLVFAHEYCSCTPATLSELARMRTKTEPAITVLFRRAAQHPGPAPGSQLWKSAEALPGSHVVWDDGGAEAGLFGARTSGYVALYSAAGKLLFHGGVTGSRGHEGDNLGLDELVAALDSGRPASHAPLVFGCALGNSMRAARNSDASGKPSL